MSIREKAKSLAIDAVTEAVTGFWPLVERQVALRWAEADILALEAEHMVMLLKSDPGFVFARKMRIGHWRRRQRRFSARAWAKNPAFAKICKICHSNLIPEN